MAAVNTETENIEINVLEGKGKPSTPNAPGFHKVGGAVMLFPFDDRKRWFHTVIRRSQRWEQIIEDLQIYAKIHPKAIYAQCLSRSEVAMRSNDTGLGQAVYPPIAEDEEVADDPDTDPAPVRFLTYNDEQVFYVRSAFNAAWDEMDRRVNVIDEIVKAARYMAAPDSNSVPSAFNLKMTPVAKALSELFQVKLLLFGAAEQINQYWEGGIYRHLGEVYLLEQAAAELNAMLSSVGGTVLSLLLSLARDAKGKPLKQTSIFGNAIRTNRRVPMAHYQNARRLAEHIVHALSISQIRNAANILKASLGTGEGRGRNILPTVAPFDPSFAGHFANDLGTGDIRWPCQGHKTDRLLPSEVAKVRDSKYLYLKLGLLSGTLPPVHAASVFAYATCTALQANIPPGRIVTREVSGIVFEHAEEDEVNVEGQQVIVESKFSKQKENKAREAKFRRQMNTRMICIRILYPVAALLRSQPIAELLSAFAKAVYQKHRTDDGRPYFALEKDYTKWSLTRSTVSSSAISRS